jgi:formylmethanofuran dehydrogenase subunit E
MELVEYNLATMGKIAERLKNQGGSFHQFDGVVYELVEEGLFEPDAGRLVRAVWDGKEIAECEECNEFETDLMLEDNSGFVMCHKCYEEEANK